VLGTLGTIEMGLRALGIAHGSGGVQAATEWLSGQVKPDSDSQPTLQMAR